MPKAVREWARLRLSRGLGTREFKALVIHTSSCATHRGFLARIKVHKGQCSNAFTRSFPASASRANGEKSVRGKEKARKHATQRGAKETRTYPKHLLARLVRPMSRKEQLKLLSLKSREVFGGGFATGGEREPRRRSAREGVPVRICVVRLVGERERERERKGWGQQSNRKREGEERERRGKTHQGSPQSRTASTSSPTPSPTSNPHSPPPRVGRRPTSFWH